MSQNPFDDPKLGVTTEQAPVASNPFDDPNFGKEPEGKGFTGHAQDLGVSLLKGAIAVPETVVGLADIPTGGRVGKFLENEGGTFGFRPGDAKGILSDMHTDEYKAQQQKFSEADGVAEKVGVALTNPSLIANTVTEALPSVGSGGVVARGMLGSAHLGTRLGAMGTKGNVLAGALGEGAVMAGMQAEGIRQETEDGLLSPEQSAISVATGGLGALFSLAGGRIAQKLGIGDVDTLVAKGLKPSDVAEEIARAPAKSIPRKAIEGAISEGFLEELPQSVSEQVLQNIALDRPWHDGIEDAAVMGTLSGMVMGAPAGAASAPQSMPPTQVQPTPTPDNPNLESVVSPNPSNGPLSAAASKVSSMQRAKDLGVEFPEKQNWSQYDSPAQGRNNNATRSHNDIDGLITLAERLGFTDEAVTLSAAKNAYERAERIKQSGNTNLANTVYRRADELYRRATETNEQIKEVSNQFPVPFVAEGEIVGSDPVIADEARSQSGTYDAEKQPAPLDGGQRKALGYQPNKNRLTDEGIIFGEEPADVREAREQREADDFSARYGQEGEVPYQAPAIEGELDRSNELPPAIAQARLPPGTGQINMHRDRPQPEPASNEFEGVGRNIVERQAAATIPRIEGRKTISQGEMIALTQQFRQAVTTKPADRTVEQQQLIKQLPKLQKHIKSGKVSVTENLLSDTDPMLVGEQIDSDWTAFADESGTLHVPRADMPQIKAEHRGALVKFLNAKGVRHSSTELDPLQLKPTQKEFSPNKVAKARSNNGGERSILVSSDGHIVDGHHQWMAKRETGLPIKAIKLNSPIRELLPIVHEFPSTAKENAATLSGKAKEQSLIETGAETAKPELVGSHYKPDIAETPDQSETTVSRLTATEANDEPYPVKSIDSGIDALDSINSRIDNGEAVGVDDIQQVFEYIANNQESVKSELNKLTKKRLKDRVSGHVWSDTKKSDLVDRAYQDMVSHFRFIGNSSGVVTSSSFGLESRLNEARQHVGTLTDQQVQQYARSRKAKIDGYREQLKQQVERLSNPKTLEDYKELLKVKGKDALTEEQAAIFDRLIAKDTMDKQNPSKEKAGLMSDETIELGEPVKGKHGKTGEVIFNVAVVTRLGKDKFKEAAAFARSMKGGYYKGNFYFKSLEDAELFSGWVNGATVDLSEKSEQQQEQKKAQANDRIKAMADRLEQQSNEQLNQDRKENTAKRLQEGDRAREKANHGLRMANIMRLVAAADSPLLKGITQKVQVELMERMVASLKYYAPTDLTNRDGNFKPEVTPEQKVQFVRMPIQDMSVSVAKRLSSKMLDKRGFKIHGRQLLATTRGLDDRASVTLRSELADKVVAYIGKHEDSYSTIKDTSDSYKRLQRMGITNKPTLRATLLEYMQLSQQVSSGSSELNRLQQLERDLQRTIVTNRRAFNDFFPTPKVLANEVIDLADIERGMRVLEPSAGNGMLADAAKSVGADVDTVEMAGPLREILSEKGHRLVGSDFLEYKPARLYDRIVMNPPFSSDQDIQHVEHAYSLIKPGGKVVAIVSSMAGERANKRNRQFREWLDNLNAVEQPLPEGAFLSSMNQTGVRTKILVIEKLIDARPAEIKPEISRESTKLNSNTDNSSNEANISAQGANAGKLANELVDASSDQASASPKPKGAKLSHLPPILKMTRKRYIEKEAKEQRLNKGSPGYENAIQRINNSYEDQLDKAYAGITFKDYQALNSDTPESINRQAWEGLREAFKVSDDSRFSRQDNHIDPEYTSTAKNMFWEEFNNGALRRGPGNSREAQKAWVEERITAGHGFDRGRPRVLAGTPGGGRETLFFENGVAGFRGIVTDGQVTRNKAGQEVFTLRVIPPELMQKGATESASILTVSLKNTGNNEYEVGVLGPVEGGAAAQALAGTEYLSDTGKTSPQGLKYLKLNIGNTATKSFLSEAVRRLAMHNGKAPNAVIYSARDTGARAGDDTVRKFNRDTIESRFSRTPETQSLIDSIKSLHPEVKLSVMESDTQLEVSKIEVPPELRSKGIGSAVMEQIISHADKQQKTLVLTPSSDFGGNKAKLTAWYKRLGFVENKGRNRDYEISESMYRPNFSWSGASRNTNAPVSRDQVDTIAVRITADWANAPEMITVATDRELPADLQATIDEQNARDQIDGVFHNGRFFLIADKIRTEADVERIVLHEALGHYGLRQLYGSSLNYHMDRLFKQVGGYAGIQRLGRKYGFDLSGYWNNSGDMNAAERRQMMADELVAHIAGTGEVSPDLIQRIAHIIRRGLRRIMSGTRFAEALSTMTDVEVLRIVAAARKAVVKGEARVTTLTHDPRFVRAFEDAMYGERASNGVSNSSSTSEGNQQGAADSKGKSLNDYKAKRSANNFSEARVAAKDFQGSVLVNEETQMEAVVSRNTLDKMLSRKAVTKSESPAGHSMAVANADHLFEKAVLGWSKADSKGETSIKAIHRYFAPFVVDGKASIVKLTVKETARSGQNNPLYSLESVELNEKTSAAWWVETVAKADGINLDSIRSAEVIYSLANAVEEYNHTSVKAETARQQDSEPEIEEGGNGRQSTRFSRVNAEEENELSAALRAQQTLGNSDRQVWDKVKRTFKRNFTAAGLLPEHVFREKILRDSEVNAHEFDTAHYLGALERAVKSAYGKSYSKLTDEQREAIDSQMKSEVPDENIPDQVREALMNMRRSITGLSGQYAEILQQQVDYMQSGMTDAERVLLDAFKRVSEIEAGGDHPQEKAAATRERNRILDEAKEAAKHAGVGNIQSALSAAANIAEKQSLLNTIISNMDSYAHRSYRAFDDPDWPVKVKRDPHIWSHAVSYLQQQYEAQGMSSEEAELSAIRTARTILEEGTAYDDMGSLIKESKLGAKDLSTLKRRKDIAPEIRALLGEYKDAKINYAKTLAKMSRLVANTKLLDRVKTIGLNEGWLFTEENKPLDQSVTKIAGDTSEVYAPLNGYYVPNEINQALIDTLGREQMAEWLRQVIKWNGIVKYGKTVLSPTTAFRNWMSAAFFAMANGHFDIRQMRKSVSGFKEYFGHGSNTEKLAYLRKLKELGVVYDTAYAGEMMELLKDSNMENTLFDSGPLRGLKTANDLAQKFYQYGDDFWKIIGFENEKAMLMKHKGMTEAEAEVEAAERIRNTYPTYSMTGRAVNWLRRFPLAGTFVSFPAEIIRTQFHMLRYLKQDMKDSPAYAARKIVGLAAVSGLAYAAQALSKDLFDVDDDEEEAVRLMAASWNANSNIWFMGRDEKGNIRYLDFSFLDPYNYFKRPINAIMRDQPIDKAVIQAGGELLSPFFGTDIAFGAVAEVWNNKKEGGTRVYNPQDTVPGQLNDIASHLRKALQPGFASNIERAFKAANGEVSRSGREYKAEEEVAAFFGFRASTFSPKTALYYNSFGFQDSKRDATGVLMDAAKNPNSLSDSDLMDAYSTARRARSKAYTDMIRLVNAARSAGMNNLQINAALRRSGISKADISALMRGHVPEWRPDRRTMRNTIRKAELLYGPEVVQRMRDRERMIIEKGYRS